MTGYGDFGELNRAGLGMRREVGELIPLGICTGRGGVVTGFCLAYVWGGWNDFAAPGGTIVQAAIADSLMIGVQGFGTDKNPLLLYC